MWFEWKGSRAVDNVEVEMYWEDLCFVVKVFNICHC